MRKEERPFVVAVGASAGGLEALRQLFEGAGDPSGLAFVVVQHLSPDHPSLLVEILSRHTELEVLQAKHGIPLAAGHVYVIEPQTLLRVAAGRLEVETLSARSSMRPIDTLMESVAIDAGDRCAGVVLSGTGSDGALGLRAIREAGGLVIVQDPESAGFDGMPRSALRDLEVDHVLTPGRIVEVVHDAVDEARSALLGGPGGAPLERLLRLLQRHTGIDFALYKQATVVRRIERRMRAERIEDPLAYLALLEESPKEVQELASELLIHVTRFFRDPGAIEALKRTALPEIVALPGPGPVRVWVAGCATGEEAYTVGLLLLDALEDAGSTRELRLFATDVSGEAIEAAGKGVFSSAIAEHLPAPALSRHFERRGEGFVAKSSLRDRLLFSRHDLTRDPPFSRLDMITCRNVLIYLRAQVQEQVLRTFSNSLNDGGLLWLGSSESLGSVASHFEPLDRRWKVFRSLSGRPRHLDQAYPGATRSRRSAPPPDRVAERIVRGLGLAIEEAVPPMLLVDAQLRLLHRTGSVGRLLNVPSGLASLDVRDMLPAELSALLTTALTRARTAGQDLLYRSLRSHVGGREHVFDLRVRYIPAHGKEGEMMALFFQGLEDRPSPPPPTEDVSAVATDIQLQLEATELELRHTRENLQTTIEELEAANEELQSTNEELMASNEELQSTNEELQSVNEELHSVNSEHQDKLKELRELTDDLDGILASIDPGIVVVARDLTLRRFNEAATRTFNIIAEDVGRPLAHVTHRLEVPDLPALCARVAKQARPEVRRVRLGTDRWARLAVSPRLSNADVDGVVVVVTDVTGLFAAERQARTIAAALEHAEVPLCVISPDGKIVEANVAFGTSMGRDFRFVIGTDFRDLSAPGEEESLGFGLETALRGRRWSGVIRSARPDGSEFWESLDLIPLPPEHDV
ncbi:MAG: chemotaxis protein CheB, partial [Myxococcota bacterium]